MLSLSQNVPGYNGACPHFSTYGVARKMNYATLGAARKRIDPMHCRIKLVCH